MRVSDAIPKKQKKSVVRESRKSTASIVDMKKVKTVSLADRDPEAFAHLGRKSPVKDIFNSYKKNDAFKNNYVLKKPIDSKASSPRPQYI